MSNVQNSLEFMKVEVKRAGVDFLSYVGLRNYFSNGYSFGNTTNSNWKKLLFTKQEAFNKSRYALCKFREVFSDTYQENIKNNQRWCGEIEN